MSKKLRFLCSSGALLFGVVMLAASLMAVDPVSSQTLQPSASAKQFYLGQEILPDHVLYPALMAVDRVKLARAEPEDRVYIQVALAQRRLESAHKLLAKGDHEVALVTLTKSQKYLIRAAQEALAQKELSEATKVYLIEALTYHSAEAERLQGQFAESELPQLVEESLTLRSQLQAR